MESHVHHKRLESERWKTLSELHRGRRVSSMRTQAHVAEAKARDTALPSQTAFCDARGVPACRELGLLASSLASSRATTGEALPPKGL
eukprot:2068068-Pleurochrysis_carterae.AAC.3